MIWVDFGNRETQEDPIYLGPVIGARTIGGGTGAVTAMNAQGRAAGGISNPNKGDSMSQTESDVSIETLSTGGAKFSRDLDSIKWELVPSKLIKKWSPRLTKAGFRHLPRSLVLRKTFMLFMWDLLLRRVISIKI